MDGKERVTVTDAAALLGTTEGALRKRIARGTLPHERDAQGRVWVLLDAGTQREDAGQQTGHPAGQDAYRELVEELRDRVRSLEEANRENRRIIAGLIQRVPELEAAPEEATQEPAGGRERAPEGQDMSETRAGQQEQTRGEQTRGEATRSPWWRRWFGP